MSTAEKESFRQRQANELEVIKSIFGPDVRDLRTKNNGQGWKPLDLVITLLPQQGSSGNHEAYTHTNLHIICPSKYPKVPPKIFLEETKGLSDVQKNELLKQLQDISQNKRGEVIIYDLAQAVQSFLHEHNKAPVGSFYDEMLNERIKRDEATMKQNAQKLSYEQQMVRHEVLKRKEILLNEDRWRRDIRRSMSESSPTHRIDATEMSESSANLFRERIYPNECDLHLSSEDLYFPNAGRKIRRGCCLGHSKKGCVAYSGIDSESGQLLYITEWTIRYAQLESKCTINCHGERGRCGGHTIDEIVQCIEKQISYLSQLKHKNLISYECVNCMRRKEGLIVFVAQDFVLGTSLNSISSTLGWSYSGLSTITRGILEALIFLHNEGVSHSNLDDCSVFMDNSGTCRVTDFTLTPYLHYLNDGEKTRQGDLPALGYLLESLVQLPSADMYDFIEMCKSERTLSASDLLEHPFLLSSSNHESNSTQLMPTQLKKDKSDVAMCPTMPAGHSRLQTEFEVQQWLGQGAYGDVLKVKNLLDNRQYAIKRIPLTSRSKQIYKKMTREVELLSRLNHENVVRYFNSWIESATEKDLTKYSLMDAGSEPNTSEHKSLSPNEDSPSARDWFGISTNNLRDLSSDSIQFINSDGEEVELEDESDSLSDSSSRNDTFSSPRPQIQIMYIQMEFCEKSTLRTAIDNNLYADPNRMWRLFREITEGLSHIHSQGMIHRDLKPVNIFLDSRDQVKIGDFGLATTSFLALQQHDVTSLSHGNRTDVGSSLTGKVGTALYVAPELMGKASKSTYNQKVDLYSLGIIFFEMCHRPFSTGMERVETLAALRSTSITIPPYMINNFDCTKQVKVMKWLLNHDQSKRPTADELLASDLLPPQRLEDNELQEFLRHVLANPQSKTYKHLVARCLAQECDDILDLTYHLGLVPSNSNLELVKAKIISLFRKHGGNEVVTPLLSPYVKTNQNNIVRLMTHSGAVIVLPHDLRLPFIKHAAVSGVNLMRRYSVDRVYREKKVFNFHPKQLYECAFDVITPNHDGRGRLIDAELISIAYELTTIIPGLNHRNLSFRLNHTSMLHAIFMHHNVSRSKWTEILSVVHDFNDHRISKFQLHSNVMTSLESSKHTATSLVDFLLTEFQLGGPKTFYTNHSGLRSLLRGHSEASLLARNAMEHVEHVVSLAHGLGVMCSIHFHAGFSIGFERIQSGGLIWQLCCDVKTDRKTTTCSLGTGGRYDDALMEFQKQALRKGIINSIQNISGAGLSFSLDKIINVLNACQFDNLPSTDIVLCICGFRSNYREVTQILKSFWSLGIRCAVVESNGEDEAQEMAKELGALNYVIYTDEGALRLRSWASDKFDERIFNREELIQHVKKTMRPEVSFEVATLHHSASFSDVVRNASSSKASVSTEQSLPHLDINFLTSEKMTTGVRRRYENVLANQISPALMLFNKKEEIFVIAVDLPPNVVKAIVGVIEPRTNTDRDISNGDISQIIEKYPENKRHIKDVIEEIRDIYGDKKGFQIVCLYCLKDSYYRFIL